MADSILRLRVEDKEYNASLKQARQGLLHLQQALQQSGATFQNVDKAAVEYARGLGRMETVAKTAKGRIGEMTSAFTDLSVQYRHLTDEEKQSPFGQALSESLSQLSGRVREAKDELADITQELNNVSDAAEDVATETSGSLSDMMSVFGGNMMTKGAELAASAIRALGDEIISTGKQAMQMSVQSEGIRMAFERLNRPDLLDHLREATHGTVNDLQLMQAAVKFEDFKLPLDELGTMLAFAQQKAKDTGQSVDYLVDSIVTGLGRQSTMILDNLGLSQTEVKERTKETGDMTVAVGQIIREQMQAAGDYVETATDRALKANAEYENSLVELGDRMRETFNIGSMDEVNMYLKNELVQTMLFTVDVIDRAKNAIHGLTGPMEDALVKMDEIGKNNGFVNFMNKVISLEGPLINVRSLLHDINSLVGGSSGGGGGLGGAMRRVSGYIDDARTQENRKKYGYYEVTTDKSGKVLSATQHKANGDTVDMTDFERKRRGSSTTPTTTGGRGGRGGRGGSKGETDQEKAAKMVANAERTYAETMQKEALLLESGIDDKLAAKKKELSAQERLFDAYNDAYATYKDPKYKDEISKTADKIKELGTEIKGMEDAVKQAKVKVEMAEGLSGFNAQTMNAWMQGRQSDLSKAEYGSQDYSTIMGNIADMNAIKTIIEQAMQAGINVADLNLDPLWEKVFDEENIPDEVWQNLVDQINEKLAALGIKPIEIDFSTGNVKKQAKEMNKDWQKAASAIQAVGSAMTAIEDPAAKVLGTIAQAVATMALSYSQASLATSNQGWGWIAFAATGLTTMLSSIAAIKSATKGFANGGIVPGNSFSGDNLRTSDIGVNLNSGELILNKAQQDTIASQLENQQVATMQPYVDGEKIFLGMNNTSQRMGRGEIVTTQTLKRLGLI